MLAQLALRNLLTVLMKKKEKKEKVDKRKRSTRVQIGALVLIRRIHPSFFMLGGLECSPCSSLAITRGWYLICTPVSCVDRIRRNDSPADKFINSVNSHRGQWDKKRILRRKTAPLLPTVRRYFDSRTRESLIITLVANHFLYYPWQIWWEYPLSQVI